MALFSFKHSVKTFSKKAVKQSRVAEHGQTLSHIRYVTRASAARSVLTERLPAEGFNATSRSVEQTAEKSGGRVCERFTIALPLEATEEQRVALIAAFAEHITKGKAGYIAAIHDKNGNDVSNPHSHLICFDAFTRKGGRGRPSSVLGMARKNAVENAAKEWATIHNRMMTDWGFGSECLIDHRSYVERGIDQIPTIHEGPGARKLAVTMKTTKTNPDWQHIDSGHSRAEANKLIREINKTKEKLNEQRADRLGGDNDAYAIRSKSRIPWVSQGGCGNRGDGRTTARQRDPSKQDPRKHFPPFTGAGRQQSGSGGRNEAAGSNCRPEAVTSEAANCVGSFRGARRVRGRGMRRTFVNLRLLRDTLQARLSRNETPRRFLEVADVLTNEPSRPFRPKREIR